MPRPARIALIVVVVILLLPVIAVASLVLVAKTQWGERWLEARVANSLQREVQIDGISFRWGWPPGVVFAHLKIGNPKWASTPALVDANGLYARVMIPPLLRGRLVIPYLGASRAQAGLEMDGDRATWKFGTPEGKGENKFTIGMVYLGDGQVVFKDQPNDTDLKVDVKGSAGEHGVINASATGKFKGQATQARATIPNLDPLHSRVIEVDGSAKVGRTEGTAKGSFSYDAQQLDLRVTLAGQNLQDLHELTAMTLPETPPYKLNGRIVHRGDDWIFDPFEGRIGASDIGGALTFTKPPNDKQRPFLKANLKSKLLDFGDLGPLVGAPPGQRSPKNPEQQAHKEQRQAEQRLLPDKPFTSDAWGKMDADVTLVANRIQRPKELPITALSTHLILKNSVMHLQPLNFGIADGHITSDIVLDGNQKPIQGQIKADVQGLHLAQLFPASQTMQDALGTLYGRAQLTGRGDSIAGLLGTSDGRIVLAIDGGQIKALLDALIPLQVGEVIMLLGKNNEKVPLRCGVADIPVQNGVARTDKFVLDTENTQIKVHGEVNFKNEALDIELDPYPKQAGILSLRTPIEVQGDMRQPKPKPKMGPLAARAAAAIGLAAVNPALAVLATLENGPGKDTDCGKVIAEARAKGAEKKQS
jgi:uncharacterized protein involved in outer membrane biogenesis